MSEFLDDTFHHSQENLLGGHDYYGADGSLEGYSQKNILGGEDHFDSSGQLAARTQPNIFDGVDVVDPAGGIQAHTEPGPTGASVYGSGGEFEGTMRETPGGGEFIGLVGHHASWQDNLLGGVNVDPMSQVGTISFPPLI